MLFNEYQEQTEKTAIYQHKIDAYVDELEIPDKQKADNLKNILSTAYEVLGLVGEAGELANKLKKVIRDNNGELSLSKMVDMAQENGDVTWYNARLFKRLGYLFSEGAALNLKKLFARKEAGTLQGSGDNR